MNYINAIKKSGNESKMSQTGPISYRKDVSNLNIIKSAISKNKPLLATCRGHQVLNVCLGDFLYQDLP